MKNEYFIEISCKIDKLMWVFCKNDGRRYWFVDCCRSHYFGGLATSAGGTVGGDTDLATVAGNTI